MRKWFAMLFMIAASLALVACGGDTTSSLTTTANPERTAEAYAIVHKDYVGYTDIVVLNGVVQEVVLEEYYLPYTWAKVTVTSETAPADVIVISGSTPSWYAKYLVIGDRHFTGELRAETLVVGEISYTKETVKYTADGIDDLFVWLLGSEANCQWYVEQLLDGLAFVADDTFAANTTLTVWSQENGFTKSATLYWTGVNYPLGWQGNMAAIIAAVEGTVLNPDAALTQNAETKFWSIGDAVSGATLTDFRDYYNLIAAAYVKTQE